MILRGRNAASRLGVPPDLVESLLRQLIQSSLATQEQARVAAQAHGSGKRALVIGGTGPAGLPLVRGLVDRGYDVTILHRGTHERDETPAAVEHLHQDPYEGLDLDGRTYDVVVVMYGRLRRIADLTRGIAGRFVSVGGVPAYRGWMNPWLPDPHGLPVPVAEDAPRVEHEEE